MEINRCVGDQSSKSEVDLNIFVSLSGLLCNETVFFPELLKVPVSSEAMTLNRPFTPDGVLYLKAEEVSSWELTLLSLFQDFTSSDESIFMLIARIAFFRPG